MQPQRGDIVRHLCSGKELPIINCGGNAEHGFAYELLYPDGHTMWTSMLDEWLVEGWEVVPAGTNHARRSRVDSMPKRHTIGGSTAMSGTGEDSHLEAAYEEKYEILEEAPDEWDDFQDYDPGPEVDDEGGMSEVRHLVTEPDFAMPTEIDMGYDL